jgi:hypothetical protein
MRPLLDRGRGRLFCSVSTVNNNAGSFRLGPESLENLIWCSCRFASTCLLASRFVLVLVVVLPPSLTCPAVERASLAGPTLSLKRKLRRTGCPRILATGVLEYWSIVPCPNCTPLPRGWDCFQGDLIHNRFAVGPAELVEPVRPKSLPVQPALLLLHSAPEPSLTRFPTNQDPCEAIPTSAQPAPEIELERFGIGQ